MFESLNTDYSRVWQSLVLSRSFSIKYAQQTVPPARSRYGVHHDDVIKWKHFPRYWRFVRGIHRWPVNSPHKGQWRGALMFFFYLCLHKLLSKHRWGRWFEMPSRPLWRHCNVFGVQGGTSLYLCHCFMNDMFLFMKSCNFYNYADDNFVSRSSPDVNVILSNLKSDCQISLKWFDDNGMKANPSKFKFMIMSSENIEPQILTISDDVCLQSQTDVKVLGITVDYRLTFNEHIRICTLKAARQLNALSRISKYLDTKSKSVLYHSFIASNFNYCPIVWHFCGVVNNNKLEKIQERSLRILFSDYESDVHDLLDSIGGQTLALRRLKFMLLEVYKCIKKVNAPCLHNLFNTNTIPYQLRTSKLE